ncbi:MAG: thiamine pyrophosphate-dependent enzyme [Deltaproteobacteria bacterium]|nr:thiamine pyrophosphate-dependent enzyme [Deltaproteobacteria bacterium]
MTAPRKTVPYKESAQKESCFRPGSTLCVGCMESIAFQNIGRSTDNGIKTIYTMGTFCGEVSTLFWPDVIAWGRGDTEPTQFEKSFSIIHNVFESAPTVAEGIRDTADLLTDLGALKKPIQVISNSGDGGALVIGLRSFLQTIHRKSKITIVVLINEFFANTGFQYAVTTTPFAETSTTPPGSFVPGNLEEPLNHIGLAVMAGAGFVAQVSPAFPKDFTEACEKALACPETSVIFVPSPCITGWKYEEGKTVELARLASETGLFPTFIKEKGKKGFLTHVSLDPTRRTPVTQFLAPQRRFHHLIREGKEGPEILPGREREVAAIQEWADRNLQNLFSLTEWGIKK